MSDYRSFIEKKSQLGNAGGFDPVWIPDFLFPFQRSLVEWNILRGCSATLADCGLGKTPMQLVWADNAYRHTRKPSLILTPLAVSRQTKQEADKFNIDSGISTDGKPAGSITITNYEQLHKFDPGDYSSVTCDEASILKTYNGATRKQVTRFMAKIPYRLHCTATAAPNDYIELGTLSESLGELSYSEMLKRFFRQLDDKGQKKESRQQDEAESIIESDHSYYQKLAYRVAQTIGQWRLKHHAVEHFWRWVASWARACRRPSDLGFSDDRFVLPPLRERDHVIKASTLPDGMLFACPAFGLGEEREERRRTMSDRCGFVSDLVKHDRPAVVWCHMNAEADMLEKMIPDSRQIAGRTPDDEKVTLYERFADESLRVLIIKPKIGAHGLNWQHCNHVVTFPSHSYEQQYQAPRRCWRFGQKRAVDLDVVATEGELRVLGNMRRKAQKADAMFTMLVKEMGRATQIQRDDQFTKEMIVPSWLTAENGVV